MNDCNRFKKHPLHPKISCYFMDPNQHFLLLCNIRPHRGHPLSTSALFRGEVDDVSNYLKGDMGKQAHALIWVRFFQFSTDFFEIFRISFFLLSSLNGAVRSDLTLLYTEAILTNSGKMKVLLYCKSLFFELEI